jgi:hypothetical protein
MYCLCVERRNKGIGHKNILNVFIDLSSSVNRSLTYVKHKKNTCFRTHQGDRDIHRKKAGKIRFVFPSLFRQDELVSSAQLA